MQSKCYLFLLVLLFSPAAAYADSAQELASQVKALQKSVAALTQLVEKQQAKIEKLEAAKSIDNSLPAEPPAQNIIPLSTGNVASSRNATPYIPDIGVVADIVASFSQNKEDAEGNDRISAREVEFVFGHDIDPYARLDVVATFSDLEAADIEEAVVTYWGLPYGVKAKVGRMRERIGKASSQHRDSLDTVDEPFVVQRYFGPEGLFRTGLELSAFTPISGDSFTQELVLGVMEGGVGEEGELLNDVRRYPTLYSHLANFYEISDTSSLELGGTFLTGTTAQDSTFDVRAFGVDVTYAHFLSPGHKLKLQSEMYLQDRDQTSVATEEGATTQYDSNPIGFYSLADYKLAERWGIGARFDYVQPTQISDVQRSSERGYTGYLTFFQSEFARWRLQYQKVNLLDGENDNRFFLQGTFAIGTHKHALN